MPRSRFQKLDDTRRDAIMVAAATAFTDAGYYGASINQILEAVGLSKGVAYYYFDDKADLFATTIEYYFEVFNNPMTANIDNLTADNFWDLLEAILNEPILLTLEKPYVLGVMKAGMKVADDDPIRERIAPIIESAFGWMRVIIARGQEYGLVRSDLPDELLYGFIMAIDNVIDNYLVDFGDALDRETVIQTHHITIDALRRLLTP